MFKWTYGHSGNDYRVATLSKSYLTSTGIIMQGLKDNSNMPNLTKKAIRYIRTYGPQFTRSDSKRKKNS